VALSEVFCLVSYGEICAALGIRFLLTVTEAEEDELSEALVAWVWEGGHGLSLMFQRGLSFLYQIFRQHLANLRLRFRCNVRHCNFDYAVRITQN
jgi:hypothetical protein